MGGLDRCLPERGRLNVTSCSHVRGKPEKLTFQAEKLTFQACVQMPELHLNA